MTFTYVSLFSGIGGFELALKHIYGVKAKCLAFAEIDNKAIAVYRSHFPGHKNLGDVLDITKQHITKLGKIDLIVAGFPCNNLSSANVSTRNGLAGDKSGLFWNMLDIIKWARTINPDIQICIENNASMANKWKDLITYELSKAIKKQVYCHYFDSSTMMIQRRRRYFWTLMRDVPIYEGPRIQTMKDVLLPVKESRQYEISERMIQYKNKSPNIYKGKGFIVVGQKGCYKKQDGPKSRWITNSSTKDSFITCLSTCASDNLILDYRLCKGANEFVPRKLAQVELERLSGFPDGYANELTSSNTAIEKAFGMTVIVPVVEYILKHSLTF